MTKITKEWKMEVDNFMGKVREERKKETKEKEERDEERMVREEEIKSEIGKMKLELDLERERRIEEERKNEALKERVKKMEVKIERIEDEMKSVKSEEKTVIKSKIKREGNSVEKSEIKEMKKKEEDEAEEDRKRKEKQAEERREEDRKKKEKYEEERKEENRKKREEYLEERKRREEERNKRDEERRKKTLIISRGPRWKGQKVEEYINKVLEKEVRCWTEELETNKNKKRLILESTEERKSVWKRRGKFEEDRIFFIDEWLSWKERGEREELVKFGTKRREEGYKVQIENRKVWMESVDGGTWCKWNEEKKEVTVGKFIGKEECEKERKKGEEEE